MSRFLYFVFLLAALAAGYGAGSGRLKWEKGEKPKVLSHIAPQREVAPTEFKSFAVILYGDNDALWCERALRSIFEQDYDYFRLIFVDDGSSDETFAKVQQFILDNQQQHRTILMKNESRLGPVASLYRAVEQCLDREIVIPCSARDWLALPTVLSRLNRSFQNPDVWITFGQAIHYPSYEVVNPPEWKPQAIEKNGYGEPFLTVPYAFYSALFKQLPLSRLFQSGAFVQETAAYLIPMLELSGGRFKSLSEPLLFQNQTLPFPEPEVEKRTENEEPLAQFPKPVSQPRADLLLFSYNRPLQLFATLESIERYLTGYEKLSVLYRADDDRFEAGYAELKQSFPSVSFIRQGANPRKDFKDLVLKTVFNSPSEYILFGVDDLIVKEETDLKICMELMEKTGAYGFYLRFGKHIDHCYQVNQPQQVPPSVSLASGVFAWEFKTGSFDWGFPNNLDMTLYRKADLDPLLENLSFRNPNGLEFSWAQKGVKEGIGLYFEHSRVVNLPLNVVTKTGNPHMNYLTPEELLVKFNQHLKIDIDPLYKIENRSPHFDYVPSLVAR